MDDTETLIDAGEWLDTFASVDDNLTDTLNEYQEAMDPRYNAALTHRTVLDWVDTFNDPAIIFDAWSGNHYSGFERDFCVILFESMGDAFLIVGDAPTGTYNYSEVRYMPDGVEFEWPT